MTLGVSRPLRAQKWVSGRPAIQRLGKPEPKIAFGGEKKRCDRFGFEEPDCRVGGET